MTLRRRFPPVWETELLKVSKDLEVISLKQVFIIPASASGSSMHLLWAQCRAEIKALYSAQHKHVGIDIVMSAAGSRPALQQEHLSRPGAQITKSPADQCVLLSNECAVNMINVIRLTVYPPVYLLRFPPPSISWPPSPRRPLSGFMPSALCSAGETFSDTYSHTDQCRPCTECTGLMRMETPCTDFNDAICVCNYNFFFDALTQQCEPCTVCPAGQGVYSHCEHHHDTVCEECVDDTYSDRESSLDPCLPCTICDEETEIELAVCTPTSDSVCHSESAAPRPHGPRHTRCPCSILHHLTGF